MVDRLRAAGCVYAEDEAARIVERFPAPRDQRAAADLRCSGTPLELVIGEAVFAGVTVTVAPGVFIPRRRAEVLITFADRLTRSALNDGRSTSQPFVAIDLGCGSGAIAAALMTRHPLWEVHGCDIDPVAVRCASANGNRYGFAAHCSDWFDGLPARLAGRLDLVVAHLPYVPTGDVRLLPRDYLAAEPASTVDGGPDGLDPWRQAARGCAGWLRPGGSIITLVTVRQAVDAASIASAAGLTARAIEYDDSVVIAATS